MYVQSDIVMSMGGYDMYMYAQDGDTIYMNSISHLYVPQEEAAIIEEETVATVAPGNPNCKNEDTTFNKDCSFSLTQEERGR